MNDAPPPLLPSSPAPNSPLPINQAPVTSGSGGGKCAASCGLGCLLLAVILGVAGYFGFNTLKRVVSEGIASYTSSEAEPIQVPLGSQVEIDSAIEKFNAFVAGISGGSDRVPLSLTADEINLLIFNHPSFSPLNGRANVSIEENQLRSKVSVNLDELDIPVKFISEAVKGKYFNGEATLSLGMALGRPTLYIEGLEVNGAAIPGPVVQELRKTNLFEEAGNNPEITEFFEKIEDMKIENGRLIFTPKAAP